MAAASSTAQQARTSRARFETGLAAGLEATGVLASSRIVVAVSGGADSVALLLGLHALRPQLGLELIAAHLDHSLRDDSASDVAFVAALASQLGIDFIAGQTDVRTLAGLRGGGLEEAGREARRQFLERAAADARAPLVALGHTRDDQAETLLLRLARGTGTHGLRGVLPRRDGLFVRPLLELGRRDNLAYLAACGQAWREDPTNSSLAFARNRVRHRVLPELEALNPRAAEALARAASIAADEDAWLDELARRELDRLAPSGAGLPAGCLAQLPRALARRVLRLYLLEQRGDLQGLGLGHIDAGLELARGGRLPLATDLPGGLRWQLAGGALSLARGRPAGPAPFAYPLAVPGSVNALEAGLRIEARLVATAAPLSRGARVHLTAALGAASLIVRNHRPGDRFRPRGAPGGKRLLRYLSDHKLPVSERATLPLVTRDDAILWVAGLHAAHAQAAASGAHEALELSVEPL